MVVCIFKIVIFANADCSVREGKVLEMEEGSVQSSNERTCFPGDVAELDEAMKVLDSSLAQIKWRLKPSTKRRLELGSFIN